MVSHSYRLCTLFFHPFSYLFLFQRLHTEYKIDNMADPYKSENDTGNIDSLEHHHRKTEAHEQRNRNDDSDLCFHGHAFFLYKGFQMLFIHIRSDEPVMQLLRRVRKTEHRHKKKRYRGKDRQYNADTTET